MFQLDSIDSRLAERRYGRRERGVGIAYNAQISNTTNAMQALRLYLMPHVYASAGTVGRDL